MHDRMCLRLALIVELVNTGHHGENEGEEPAEIIAFYAGKPGTPIAVEKPQ